ncbi:uncharacterized protein PHACADRAFT_191481 [Phanerochaete carnosa HHB-10118-sp]|uniref:Carbohydrate-binding module family 1 protein n=1 Tax=Phanerochaete carnosa (strain HHB-10118-sp) TaxID=650164 RepID=K5WJ66_PHACS|nr:uncharacterized protein PHACADRAFT_191481 [Phanerochaete carnosa HHB-10118-sp]EKM59164.1 hypothetical protein PHACADRAFT_191481 [Phanerochaete carnosa HHB-10118-sp]
MLALLLLCASWVMTVLAIPSFEGVTSWTDIGSLVPGMTTLEAIGPSSWDDSGKNPFYFTIDAPHGLTGNATVKKDSAPPLFYIHNNQLWNFHNASTIYPVNTVNATKSSQLPLQVVVGKPGSDVVKGGSWRWQGTMLLYEYGSTNNSGVYYSCQDTNGLMGLFLFLRG